MHYGASFYGKVQVGFNAESRKALHHITDEKIDEKIVDEKGVEDRERRIIGE
jgi:hypothetical protein